MSDILSKQNFRYIKGTSINFWLDNRGILDDERSFLRMIIEFYTREKFIRLFPISNSLYCVNQNIVNFIYLNIISLMIFILIII